MLSPTEFSVGSIGDATTLTLVLPRGKYEYGDNQTATKSGAAKYKSPYKMGFAGVVQW